MQERILQYINKNHMIQKGDHIIVGLSGGADSVCLFHILQQLQEQASFIISAIHINHCLREKSADADEQFVKGLCRQYQVNYKSIAIDVKAEAQRCGMSIEEAGRVVRRKAFEEFATECQANKIALGHHQDDQAETVIFNLVRGSGLSGLCGIHPVRGQYIRPLLAVSKTEIEDYLTSHKLEWRVDESNLTDGYTRNNIRHNIIKSLEEINPKASDHIASSARHLLEIEEYLQGQVKVCYENYVKGAGEDILIAESLAKESPLIQKLVMRECVRNAVGSLKNLTQKNIMAMTTIFDKEVGKRIEIGRGFVIRRTYDAAVVELAKYNHDKKQI